MENTSNEKLSRSGRQENKIWDGNKENSKCIYSTYFKRLKKILHYGSISITPEFKILRQEDWEFEANLGCTDILSEKQIKQKNWSKYETIS